MKSPNPTTLAEQIKAKQRGNHFGARPVNVTRPRSIPAPAAAQSTTPPRSVRSPAPTPSAAPPAPAAEHPHPADDAVINAPAPPHAASAEKPLSPEQIYAMAKMGYTQWEYGKLDRARAIFQTLVVQKPDEPWFRCALGSIFQKQRNFAQAIQQYNMALQLDPRDLASRVNRGEIFLKVGKAREAQDDLVSAVKADASGRHPSALRARSLLSALKHQLSGAPA